MAALLLQMLKCVRGVLNFLQILLEHLQLLRKVVVVEW